MTGRIHSLETMGTVDGPGMRMVVFLQGCPMRCAYCHNPDTWDETSDNAKFMTVKELWDQYERNRQFYTNGGITVTGGGQNKFHLYLNRYGRFFHGNM